MHLHKPERNPIGRAPIAILVLLAGFTAVRAQEADDAPTWGRMGRRPEGANTVFATADGCALCHSASDRAVALHDSQGQDASPHHLWRGTMMAQALHDPYFRAQLADELRSVPGERRAATEDLCLRCHAPMASHSARIEKTGPLDLATCLQNPLARDGVSCTVCHQAHPDNFGRPESFEGRLDIRPGRRIFGPYPNPITGPMRMHSAFVPEQGDHIRRAGLCGSCHTLETSAGEGSPLFLEQGPYLEWRNSVFGGLDESDRAVRSCQECHMAELPNMRIARNPAGRDFVIDARPRPRSHAFIGGNAFMLDLMADNAETLGIETPAAILARTAKATRIQLQERTAALTISEVRVAEGKANFGVTVKNRTGHKLPTAYPSRRLVLQVEVRQGGRTIFLSGGFTEDGRLADVADEALIPHETLIRSPRQVQVWEAIPEDGEGRPTTRLTSMVRFKKDNRLLPAGWQADGPHAERTRPVGVAGDLDYVDGADTVAYEVPLDGDDEVTVIARLLLQVIPPRWVDPLRDLDHADVRRFLSLYDATSRLPEPIGFARR